MKLALKVLLTLALSVAVALVSAGWLIERNVATVYRAYVDETQQQQLAQVAAQAEALYAVQPDWSAVQQSLNRVPGGMAGMAQGARRGPMMGRGAGHMGAPPEETVIRYLIVDPTTGVPLAGGGTPVTEEQRRAGAPIHVGERVAAMLVPAVANPPLGVAETTVLAEVREAVLLSAGVAGLAAVLLGGVLVWTLIRPLRALRRGVAALAQGNLETQVAAAGHDELGELAVAFNQMARSLHRQEELRQRMLADIAHELRTPLSVVQGNLQAILDGVYPLALDEVRTVYDETQLLSRLVHDLHELAQAEAGALPLERQPVEVAAALQQMAALFAPLAAAKQVALEVQAPAAGLSVFVDPDRLQQILHNLLGNAIRHTPACGRVCLGGRPQGAERVRLWVTDSGAGIAAEHLPHVFSRFYRADNSRTRRDQPTAGAGLGLAIARAFTEAHQGTIGVESPPGAGATFWVDLPLHMAPRL